MPTFYLHLCNGTAFDEDRVGRILPSVEHARTRALVHLREMLESRSATALDPASFVEIEDETHKFLMTVTLADVGQLPSGESGRC